MTDSEVVYILSTTRPEAQTLATARGWTHWIYVQDTVQLRGRIGGRLIIVTCWSRRHQGDELPAALDAARASSMSARYAQCVLSHTGDVTH